MLRAYHADPPLADSLLDAGAEVRSDWIYYKNPGLTAENVKVGMVEGGVPCWGPHLPTLNRAGDDLSTHATATASCITSTHPSAPGIAQGALVYAAERTGSFLTSPFTSLMQGTTDAIHWTLEHGCSIVNLSFNDLSANGAPTGIDHYVDYIAVSYGVLPVVSAGNGGGHVGAPGSGYNILSVGSFYSGPDTSWSGESMAPFSAWKNPQSGLEAPQIVAPGAGIEVLLCDGEPGSGGEGTSLSAPIVAGAAALCVQRDPGLKWSPEALRAILMASAWHNIEGYPALSGKDGAGGLSARGAWNVTGRGDDPTGGYRSEVLWPSDFDSDGLWLAQRRWVQEGKRVRGALAFNSGVDKGATLAGGQKQTWHASALDNDYDLYVYGPSGNLVATSMSDTNSFEVVEFEAQETGPYEFHVKAWDLVEDWRLVGTAVSHWWDG